MTQVSSSQAGPPQASVPVNGPFIQLTEIE